VKQGAGTARKQRPAKGGGVADIEFRVVSDRREGLLLELGQLIIASGFTLQRQRMTRTDEGVVLTMVVRGPEANLLGLEDRLSSHPLVLSFEAQTSEGMQAAAPSRAPEPARPPAMEAGAGPAPTMAVGPDHARVEILLPQLAREYPKVLNRVVAFEHELAVAQREATTRYAGSRLGAWVYKREYALGARLNLADSVRHIVLPAMRQLLLDADMHGDTLRIANSPFVNANLYRGASCHFLKGCLEGMLNEPGHLGHPRVVETFCRNSGADACTFTFSA
jgi:predicted hydrocarbon binding protein